MLLTNLKKLDLENNLLTELTEEIGNLSNLEELVLSENQLIALPQSIGDLISLKKLFVQNNQLGSLPESTKNLIHLEWLYINDNAIKGLPFISALPLNTRSAATATTKIDNILYSAFKNAIAPLAILLAINCILSSPGSCLETHVFL